MYRKGETYEPWARVDFFGRTQAEAAEEAEEFIRVTEGRDLEGPLAERFAVESYAPGEESRTFHKLKGHGPKTETDRFILTSLDFAPISLGFVSNPLLYGSAFRYMKRNDKKRMWGLFRGGLIHLFRTFPSNYWLVTEGW